MLNVQQHKQGHETAGPVCGSAIWGAQCPS